MQNIYEQVQQNKFKSNLVVFLFIAFIVLLAYALSFTFNLDSSFLAFAILFSCLSGLVSFFYGDKIVLKLNNAHLADRKNYFNYYTAVENLSIANQTPMPKIYIIDNPSPNAFATGRDPSHAVVCVTTGLLEKLNKSEIEAVIAHELSHIKNYDIRLMMIISMLVGSLSILIRNISRNSLHKNRENDRNSGPLAILGFILIIFAPIIAKLIQLTISRRREFLADASAIKLTRQPQSLIDALIKISSDPNIIETASTATASLYISNPFKNNKFASMFSTHPPIKQRIQALQQML
ncbi:M48 family metallopeptidase [Patescibacteria group bacterium]|nr:M48 family metallopeptidase [Patescibacteria group bacterium]MCG2701787.1 M48 family metallopeptidase [Candidatus Parcubacteria bacterium]MBU4264691.1 M48 family metallopeptidase [Patescibacteria group bacterium]MBU4390646.1 M48 family metallopeptidase [Patescibacteria group bacterium]MBU4396763.1 M48 family metallopeptidase [Patescibacteria group bacterium]